MMLRILRLTVVPIVIMEHRQYVVALFIQMPIVVTSSRNNGSGDAIDYRRRRHHLL